MRFNRMVGGKDLVILLDLIDAIVVGIDPESDTRWFSGEGKRRMELRARLGKVDEEELPEVVIKICPLTPAYYTIAYRTRNFIEKIFPQFSEGGVRGEHVALSEEKLVGSHRST